MLDLSLVPSLAWLIVAGTPGTDVTPIDSATSSIVSYVLGYGLAGVVAVAFAFGFIKPASAVKNARAEARADLEKELERVIAEKERDGERHQEELRRLQEKLDDALRTSRDMVPILVQFTSASSSLIPLLQDIVSNRRGAARGRDTRD